MILTFPGKHGGGGSEGGRSGSSGKLGPKLIGQSLGGTMGHLMRRMRKYQAMRACLDALPDELDGLASPADVRMALPEGHRSGSLRQRSGKATGVPEGDASAMQELNTLYIYVANATVEGVLEEIKPGLIKTINKALPLEWIEAVRIEQASQAKIKQNVNNLLTRPD